MRKQKPVDPIPIEQTDDRALEQAILNGLLFHSMNADVPEIAALGQLVHISTFEESGRKAPLNSGEYEQGLMLTMADGSEFELVLIRTRRAEYQFVDQVE